MKGIRLSKTSWLILSAGVFIVVLAGLGLARSQQSQEQTKIDEELALTETRLNAFQTAELSQQVEELRARIEEGEAQLDEARMRLDRTVVSADVVEEFFRIATSCSVNVTSMSTTPISRVNYEGINFSATGLSAAVTGTASNLIDLIISLNNSFTTGAFQTAQITIESPPAANPLAESEASTVSVNLIVYSYEVK